MSDFVEANKAISQTDEFADELSERTSEKTGKTLEVQPGAGGLYSPTHLCRLGRN